jgi:hypothetical protein
VQRNGKRILAPSPLFRHRCAPAAALLKRKGSGAVFYGETNKSFLSDQTERMEVMKHLKNVSRAPQRAQAVTVGSVLTVIGKLLTVAATFFTTKEASTTA